MFGWGFKKSLIFWLGQGYIKVSSGRVATKIPQYNVDKY